MLKSRYFFEGSVAGLWVAFLLLIVSGSAHAAGGDLLWEDRFGQPGSDENPALGAIAAGNGAVFIAGKTRRGGGDTDFLVRAYDATDGRLLWRDSFDRGGGDDDALGITLAGERVIAVGAGNLDANFVGIPLIRAYDSKTGLLLWQNELADGRGVFGRAVVHQGRVIAVGGNTDWLIQAYEAETGAALWQDRFGVGTGNRAISVAEGDGRVFVGGKARPPSGRLSWLVRAYDAASGNVLWEDYPVPSAFAQATRIAVEGNRVIAVGLVSTSTPTPPFFNRDWLVRVYNAKTGKLLWQDLVDKGGFGFPEGASDVTVRKGRAFVAGSGGSGCGPSVAAPDNCDFIVRAYALETGQLLWEDQLNRAPLDLADSIAAADHRVFAGGSGGNNCDLSGGPATCGMIVRAYDAKTGELLWEDQVDSIEAGVVGQGVATHGGSVFATGYFLTPGFFLHGLVRAYDAGIGR
jgi:glucose dehydrogenase